MAEITQQRFDELKSEAATQGISESDLLASLTKRGHTIKKAKGILERGVDAVKQAAGEIYHGAEGYVDKQNLRPEAPPKSTIDTIKDTVIHAIPGVGDVARINEAITQGGGDFAKYASDAIGSGIKGVAKTVLNEDQQAQVKGAIQAAIASPLGQLGLAALKKGGEEWQKFSQSNPDLAKKIEDYGHVAELGSQFIPGGLAKKPLTSAVTKGVDMAQNAAQGVVDAAPVVGDVVKTATGKAATGASVRAMQMATGVEGDVAKRWYQASSKTPELVEKAKQTIEQSPNAPFLTTAQELGTQIQGLKTTAREMYDAAKTTALEADDGARFSVPNTSIAKFNKALRDFSLKFKDGKVVGSTRVETFSPSQLGELTDIMGKLRLKNLSREELLNLDTSIKNMYDSNAMQGGVMRLIGKRLTTEASDMIDELLPEINDANAAYRTYHTVMDKIGGKLIDDKGNLLPGAESYLSNLIRANKGKVLKDADEASTILGRNIVDEVQLLKDAQRFSSSVGATQRNRFWDFLSAGGVGAGNIPAAITGITMNALSNPKRYGQIIELLAKAKAGKINVTGIKNHFEKLGDDSKQMIQDAIDKTKSGVTEEGGANVPKVPSPLNNADVKPEYLGKVPESKIKIFAQKLGDTIYRVIGSHVDREISTVADVKKFISDNKGKKFDSVALGDSFSVDDITERHLTGGDKPRSFADIVRRGKLLQSGIEIAEKSPHLAVLDDATSSADGVVYHEIIGSDPERFPGKIINVKISEKNKGGKSVWTVVDVNELKNTR